MRRIHTVNVIKPVGYGCRKHDVDVVIVAAESEAEALALVATEQTNDALIMHRHVHEADACLTWTRQSWTKHDVLQALRRGECREPRQLAPYKYAEHRADIAADGEPIA